MTAVILWTDDSGQVVALTPPGGLTIGATLRSDLVPHDRPKVVADSATLPHDAPLVAWRLGKDGKVAVDRDAALAAQTPAEILPLQARRYLRHVGLLDRLNEWVKAQGPDAQDAWDYALSIKLDDQLVKGAAEALGFDAAEAFRQASKL